MGYYKGGQVNQEMAREGGYLSYKPVFQAVQVI